MTYSTFLILPQPSTVSIEGSSSLHPLHARASGPIGSVEAQDNASGIRLRNGSISLEVATLQSGNPLVDRETRRRIDAGRYPQITGRLLSCSPTGPNDCEAAGEITFRGVTTAVTGLLTMAMQEDTLRINGRAALDVREWGLSLPRLGPLKVHPQIVVTIEISAQRQP